MHISLRAKKRAYTLEKLSVFFKEFARKASMGTTQAKEILEELSQSHLFECFSFIHTLLYECLPDSDLCELWQKNVNTANELSCLRSEEKEMLKNFSSVFLSSSLADFVENCNKFGVVFEGFGIEARAQMTKTQKLSLSCSALGAAAFFIIAF